MVERRSLSPEEVGERVSAILVAAERDARAVIEASHREPAADRDTPTLAELAREVDALARRLEALERAVVALARPASPRPVAQWHDRRTAADPAARVRAIELALAGYSREAIARELAASMDAADIERLLDEVLTG
jgi:hypothetical protein